MVADPFASLRAAGLRSRVQGAAVALLSGGLGAGMISLHALGLDPDTAKMSTTMLALLYGFGGLFILVGAGLLYLAIWRTSAEVKELESRLSSSPGSILAARRMVATRRGVGPAHGEGEFGQHQVHIEGADGRVVIINASAAQVTAVLHLVAQRCPRAQVTGRG